MRAVQNGVVGLDLEQGLVSDPLVGNENFGKLIRHCHFEEIKRL